MKIIAIIVTYNRLGLLKKCVAKVAQQTRLPDETIVINNGSTDDTGKWLSGQPVTVFTQKNIGGAGGFAIGIRNAYEHDADWIWAMDDDTIPELNALEELLKTLDELGPDRDKVGFLSSKVLWVDGNKHETNKTYLLKDEKKLDNLLITNKKPWSIIQFGTFVSMLISAKAVEKTGLPFKEYFIWNDDVEYTKRIINSGMAGIAVEQSIVIHETPVNRVINVFKDNDTELWKYRYGMRNELYTKKLHDGDAQFWTTWLHRMIIMPFRIAFNRKNNRWPFIKIIWQTSLDSLFFRPVIVQVKTRLTK